MLHAIRYCNDRRNNSVGTGESFGIGNTHTARHGELIFEQDGAVNIQCRGKKSICIGSGTGGKIRIHRGEYNLNSNTEAFVGIGTLDGESTIELQKCHIEADCSATSGVMIGSLNGNVNIFLKSSAFNFCGDGNYLSGIGSLHGKRSSVGILESGIDFNMSGDHAICLGTLYGASDIQVGYSSLRLTNAGQKALIFGGYDKNTTVRITNSDTKANLRCAIGKETFAPDENIVFINGRRQILLNGTEIERTLTFDYA